MGVLLLLYFIFCLNLNRFLKLLSVSILFNFFMKMYKNALKTWTNKGFVAIR